METSRKFKRQKFLEEGGKKNKKETNIRTTAVKEHNKRNSPL